MGQRERCKGALVVPALPCTVRWSRAAEDGHSREGTSSVRGDVMDTARSPGEAVGSCSRALALLWMSWAFPRSSGKKALNVVSESVSRFEHSTY